MVIISEPLFFSVILSLTAEACVCVCVNMHTSPLFLSVMVQCAGITEGSIIVIVHIKCFRADDKVFMEKMHCHSSSLYML